jgi:hypothetical protein
MTIRWDIYSKVSDFTPLEAAFLWCEIEPTSELLEFPPHLVLKIKSQINQAFTQILTKRCREQINRAMAKGLSETEAIEKVISGTHKSASLYRLSLSGLSESEKLAQQEKILPNTPHRPHIHEFHLLEKGHEILQPSSLDRKILIEIAELLGGKPKFLFPGVDNDSVSTKERQSYLRLIKGLLNRIGKDPAERGITKELLGFVTDAGQRLSHQTVLKILKEVQELEED